MYSAEDVNGWEYQQKRHGGSMVSVRIIMEVTGDEGFRDERVYSNTSLKTAVMLQDKLNKADREIIDEQKKALSV